MRSRRPTRSSRAFLGYDEGMKSIRIALTSFASAAVTYVALTSFALAQNTLQNPLNSQFSTIPNFISGVLKVLVIIALPIITLFIVYSGFKFVSAQGNSEKLGEAKRNFQYVILGAILILGAWLIATLIGGTVTQVVGAS